MVCDVVVWLVDDCHQAVHVEDCSCLDRRLNLRLSQIADKPKSWPTCCFYQVSFEVSVKLVTEGHSGSRLQSSGPAVESQTAVRVSMLQRVTGSEFGVAHLSGNRVLPESGVLSRINIHLQIASKDGPPSTGIAHAGWFEHRLTSQPN